MRANTTLVINPKGGSGKTTVAINLASYFAANGVATAVMDYDSQGSSLNWLRIRPVHAPRIHGANAAPQKTGLRSLGMHVPAAFEQVIIDAPAGASGLVLQEMLSRAHCILIPVAPSAGWAPSQPSTAISRVDSRAKGTSTRRRCLSTRMALTGS